MLASEVTLIRFLRRTELVKGYGFDMPTRSTGDYLDESQVTYPDPAGFITRENDCDERDAITYKFNMPARLGSQRGFISLLAPD